MRSLTMSEDHAEHLPEIVLKGHGVSPGVAVGPVYLVNNEEERYVERAIGEEEIEREISRFEDALIRTRSQLLDIQKRVSEAIGQESASIFDAHMLVVDDRSFIEEVIKELRQRKKNVEAIVYLVANRYAEVLAQVADDYLRERASDLKDVSRRILRNLSGSSMSNLEDFPGPCIVVSNDLAPSDTAMMDRSKVIGFATDLGSQTSHTAIMARALEIPAIVGLHDVSIRLKNGEQVLVDGTKGLFVLNPTAERLQEYGALKKVLAGLRGEMEGLHDLPAETTDGYQLDLVANIELPSEVEAVDHYGGEGVGLFRSEFLYLASDSLPSEDAQSKAYCMVAQKMNPRPVVIRTLDLGGDKFVSSVKLPEEHNPFMGWRAIRYCLAQPEIFKTQLRAVLRASAVGKVKLMYPMICQVEEVIAANKLLEEAKDDLRAEGAAFDEHIEVGSMIEIPSAALSADLIAPHVSFFSIGTNDLVQYALAVDRVNERVGYLYEPTHPAIIRLIRDTVKVAHKHGITVSVCGEMAGNPLMTPLLLGLGIDGLSMSPAFLPLVKKVVRSITYSDAENLAERVQTLSSGSAILNECRKVVFSRAPDIRVMVE